jgi:hypothetical protein
MIFVYYVVSLIDESVDLKTDPLEVAEMKWIEQGELSVYDMYPQFKEAVEDYFNKKI